jgi:oligosaccharyltransferase complex subunit epsilon
MPFQCLSHSNPTNMSSAKGTLEQLIDSYRSTPVKVKIMDVYLVYVLLTGIAQFAYCLLVGTFPFNSFLSGFISTVGCFVLTGSSGASQDPIG